MGRARSRDLFPTDAPLPGDLLIGRAADVSALRAELGAGVHQVLLGPRRTGKTSVCRAAVDALAGDGLYVVSLDLFALTNRAELARALAAGVVANRGALARGARQLRRAGRSALTLASASLTAKLRAELGEDIEIAFNAGAAERDPEASLAYALTLPQAVVAADGAQLVLFIDEFQELAHPRRPFGDPDALSKQLRTALQDSPQVTALFTGSVDHLMRELFVPSHRAFHRFGVTRHLSEITDEQWLRGLSARFDQDGVRCRAGALERLLERSGRHPRTTMLIAQQAHLTLLAAESRDLSVDAVEEGFFAALAADAVGHYSETERIRQFGGVSVEVARRLARGERPYPDLPRGQVERALAALREAGMIERSGRGEYRFTDPLLEHYLSRQ